MDVKKVLAQKKWTGADLGRLGIINALALGAKADGTIKAYPGAFPEPLPLTSKELQAMVNTLAGRDKEVATWNKYRSLQIWMDSAFTKTSAFEQQVQLRLLQLNQFLGDMLLAEGLKTLELTDSEREKLTQMILARTIEALVVPEDFKANIEVIKESWNLVTGGLLIVKGFNTIVEASALEHNLPELGILKRNVALLEDKIKLYNSSRERLKAIMEQYTETRTKARSLELLEKGFKPLPERPELPSSWLYNLKEEVKSFRAFTTEGETITRLMEALRK